MARAKKVVEEEVIEIKEEIVETKEDKIEAIEEVTLPEGGEGGEVLPPPTLPKTFVLDKVNMCSVKDEMITLANPIIVVENEEVLAVVEALVKTGKLKEL